VSRHTRPAQPLAETIGGRAAKHPVAVPSPAEGALPASTRPRSTPLP